MAISDKFDFKEFIAYMMTLDPTILIAHEARKEKEWLKRRGYGPGCSVDFRKRSKEYFKRVQEFSHFADSGYVPSAVYSDDLLLFQQVAEKIVASGLWRAEVLQQFSRPPDAT